MTKLLLVRHGHVEGIDPPRFRGRQDLPLTASGKAQAERLAQHLCSHWRPVAVYTSPMSRCVETGGPIAEACAIPSRVLSGLNDIDYGLWQFRTYREVETSDAALYKAWFATPHLVRFPEGESLQELVSRTAEVLRFVLKQHPAETVVLVGHDSVNRALLTQLLDQPLSSYWRLEQSPCCLNEIDFNAKRVLVKQVNATAHLQNELPSSS